MKNALLFGFAMLAVGCGQPGRWDTPVELLRVTDRTGMLHRSPQIVAAGSGQAMAVWLEPLDEENKHHRVQFSSFDADRGWQVADTITETITDGDASRNSLAMNDAGEAALAVVDRRGLTVLQFARGQGWSRSRGPFGAGAIGGARVAIGQDGTIVVLWSEPLRQPPVVYASRYSPVTGWGSDDAISSSRDAVPPPRLASGGVTVDRQGNAVATWVEATPGRHPGEFDSSVWTNHAEKGSPWSSPQRIEEGVRYPEAVLAGNPKGEAIVAWRTNDLRVSRFRDGIWTAPQSIAKSNVLGIQAQAAMGDSGDAMVIWLNFINPVVEPLAVEAVRYDRRQGWARPQTLWLTQAQIGGLDGSTAGGVVVDRDGNATVIWNGEPGIVAYRYDVGGGWRPREVIGVGEPLSDVKVAVDGVGNVVAMWTAPYGIYVNRFESAQ